MRLVRLSMLGAAFAFSGMALADNEWQTVKLEKGLAIDLPASVGKDYLPDEQFRKDGELFYFAVSTPDSGRLFCTLSRAAYAAKMGAKETAAGFALPATREKLCSANYTTGAVIESRATTAGGYPAGACVARYTEAGKKISAGIVSVLAVAAPHESYQLYCEVEAATPEQAQTKWETLWSAKVAHIQDSLHLAADRHVVRHMQKTRHVRHGRKKSKPTPRRRRPPVSQPPL